MEQVKKLYIKGTSKTPEINFAPGLIQISGRSIPEDAVAFYHPLVKWIENYIQSPEEITKVKFNIEYINSGSNRFVYNMLKLIENCHIQGHKISVDWFYEEDDDTIMNLGLDFKTLLSVPFNLVIMT